MEGFFPPLRDQQGNLAPHPEGRYLTIDVIRNFVDGLKFELKEVGGQLLLNKTDHLFRKVEAAVIENLREDAATEQKLKGDDRPLPQQAGGASGVTSPVPKDVMSGIIKDLGAKT